MNLIEILLAFRVVFQFVFYRLCCGFLQMFERCYDVLCVSGIKLLGFSFGGFLFGVLYVIHSFSLVSSIEFSFAIKKQFVKKVMCSDRKSLLLCCESLDILNAKTVFITISFSFKRETEIEISVFKLIVMASTIQTPTLIEFNMCCLMAFQLSMLRYVRRVYVFFRFYGFMVCQFSCSRFVFT